MPPSTTEFKKADQQYSTEIQSVSRHNPCPLCNGEYQCYIFGDKVGCASLDEAPGGWERLKEDRNGRWIFTPISSRSGERRKGKSKAPKDILPNADDIFPLFLVPRTEDDFPQWQKTGNRHGHHYEAQIEYLYPCPESGEPMGKIVRKQWSDRRPAYGKNRDESKEIRPWHWASPTDSMKRDGIQGWWSDRGKGKKPWGLYRQEEIESEIASGGEIPILFYMAGEQAVESARSLGFWAITNQGGEGSFHQQIVDFVKLVSPKIFIIWGDHDATGKGSSEKLLKAALKAGIPAINLDVLGIWPGMPHKGDIADVMEKSGMSGDEIIRALEEEIRRRLREEESGDDDWANSADEGSSEIPIAPSERLRLDIKALLKESDLINYEVMRADIQARYRLNNKALERIISSISQLSKAAEVVDLGLDELFDLPCDNIEYIIPGMLPQGEAALLIANPKAGKSLLAYDAAFAVASGEDTFLGERCKQGKVLIVQCDESTGTAKGRLLKRGFRREDAPNVRFMHKFSITQLGALESKLETFRPTLVIIDSLRRINAGREISENSAEFADNIYQLKELCAQYNAALLLIHHSNKNIDAVGVEKVRGSSAIAGAVWGIWDLTQIPKPDPNNKKKLIIDPKDPTRILNIIARDVEGQRLTIELDPENNHWLNHGQQGISEEEAKEQKTHSARVVELLKSTAPVGLEACEINEHLGIGRGVYSILNRLLGQKIIGSRPSDKDRRRTVYFCSTVTRQNSDNPPPPTDLDPIVIEYAEPIDISTVESSITFDHNSITFDHTTPDDEEEKQASNLDSAQDTAYSITSDHDEGGREKRTLLSVTVVDEVEALAPPPFEEQQEADFDEFPHQNPRASWDVKKRRAMEIKCKFEACKTADDFLSLRDSFTREELNWVRKELVSQLERDRFKRVIEMNGLLPIR